MKSWHAILIITATYAGWVAANDEDCVGIIRNGIPGNAICTGAIPVPAAGGINNLFDKDYWKYSFCDYSSINQKAYCEGILAGSYALQSNGSYACVGATAALEPDVVPRILVYGNIILVPCGPANMDSDSNWGQGFVSGGCWSGPPYGRAYQNGILVWDERLLYWSGPARNPQTGNCTSSYGQQWSALRYRATACPLGYRLRSPSTNPNALPGDFDCWKMPVQRCENGNAPAVGNPIRVADANKIQRELDVAQISAGGLSFIRTFSSGGHFDVVPGTLEDASSHWRHNYQRRIISINDNSTAIAAVQEEDGSIRYFSSIGIPVHNMGPGDLRLERLVDANGVSTGWRLKSDTAVTEEYNTSGQLVRITDRTGTTRTVTYSDTTTPPAIAPTVGLPIYVVDSFGRTLSLTYDAQARLVLVVEPNGNPTSYRYDSSGNPTNADYADGSTRTYRYEDTRFPYFLTGIDDENASPYTTYGYDTSGRAISTRHAGGTNFYTLNINSPTTITDPLGSTRQYWFANKAGVSRLTAQSQPSGSGCGASSSAITYDANGNASSRTDFAGHKTCYANDLTRNLETKRVEGLSSGASCTTSLATPPAPTAANPVRVISTVWHPDWRLEAKRTEPRKMTTWVYHGQPDPTNGNAIASCAPASALLPDGKPIVVLCKKIEQATTDATGASGFAATVTGNPRTWTWTYNGFGQVLTAKGPRTDINDTTTYTYYADTAADHTLDDLASITNPAGHVTTYDRYDRNGRLLRMTDANGLITTLTHSPRGWLKTRQVGTELTTYDYDNVGQLKRVTLPDGAWIGHDYDPAHRLIATYDHQGNRIAYTLDNAGNRTKEDVTDPAGYLVRTQTRVHDALSRVQNVVQPQ